MYELRTDLAPSERLVTETITRIINNTGEGFATDTDKKLTLGRTGVWWPDHSPNPWAPRHGPELNISRAGGAESAVCWWTEVDKIDSGPEVAGGRPIPECRAAGDERSSGHDSADPRQRWIGLAGGLGSCPKAGQTDRRMGGRQAHIHATWGTSPISHGCCLLPLLHPSRNFFSWLLLLPVITGA